MRRLLFPCPLLCHRSEKLDEINTTTAWLWRLWRWFVLTMIHHYSKQPEQIKQAQVKQPKSKNSSLHNRSMMLMMTTTPLFRFKGVPVVTIHEEIYFMMLMTTTILLWWLEDILESPRPRQPHCWANTVANAHGRYQREDSGSLRDIHLNGIVPHKEPYTEDSVGDRISRNLTDKSQWMSRNEWFLLMFLPYHLTSTIAMTQSKIWVE